MKRRVVLLLGCTVAAMVESLLPRWLPKPIILPIILPALVVLAVKLPQRSLVEYTVAASLIRELTSALPPGTLFALTMLFPHGLSLLLRRPRPELSRLATALLGGAIVGASLLLIQILPAAGLRGGDAWRTVLFTVLLPTLWAAGVVTIMDRLVSSRLGVWILHPGDFRQPSLLIRRR